jgi:hypothetical protein
VALQATPAAAPALPQRISLAVSVLLVGSGTTARAATPFAIGAGTPTPRAGGLPPLSGMRVQLVNAFGDVLAEAITPDSGEVTLRRDLAPGTAVFIRVPSADDHTAGGRITMSLLKSFRSPPSSNGSLPQDDSAAHSEAQPQKAPQKKLLARDRMEAKHQEDDVGLWRDYHAFLTAKQTLLEVRAAEARAAFEQADTLEADARAAQGRLDAIPAPTRTMFEHVLEERRQRVQGELEAALRMQRGDGRGRHVDPDDVDRAALEEMLGEAQGTITENGYGWFPRGVAGDVRWYAMDVAELLAAPTAASYAVRKGDGDDARKRIMQSALMGAGLLVFLVVWFVLPHGPKAPVRTTANTPSVNGAPVEVWAVQQALLTTKSGATTALTVTATTAAIWPQQTDADHRAYWNTTAVTPLRLCVPSAALADLTSVRLISATTWPERVYTLGAARSAATDLIVESCAAAGKQAPRYGVLQETVPLPANAIGAPVSLGMSAQTLTVQAVRVVGPGQDGVLPVGQGRIVVQVQAREGLDWPAYKPTLTLADGQQYLPSETTPTPGDTELRYLVPLPVGEITLAWDVTAPGAVQSLRWRATLAPPPSRAAVLRDALQVTHIKVREERPGELTIALAIANVSAEPLALTRDELTLAQAAQPIPFPDLPALAAPLQPGEQRTLSFTAPVGGLQQAATLTIGGVPFQITR